MIGAIEADAEPAGRWVRRHRIMVRDPGGVGI
jgi:hypothetical protein